MYSAEGLGFDCHMWPWAWTEQRAWTGEGGMWTHRWESEAMSQLVAVVFVSQSWSRGAKWSRNSQLHSLRPIMKGVRCAPVWLLFSVLMLRALHVDASIHTYKNGKFAAESNAFIYWGGNEGLYASSNHVQGQGAANGRSFISFESVTFTRTEEAAKMHEPGTTNSQVEAIVVEVKDKNKIGDHAFPGKLALCCTADLARSTGCKEGSAIIEPDAQNWPLSIVTRFTGQHLTASMIHQKINITKTGMYTLIFVACERELEGLTVEGKTVWKNPTGYLPGRMSPFMTFYSFMALAYGLLGAFWFFQYMRNWKDILQLQNCISAVIALGMSEMALWYFDYLNFNMTGSRPMGITMWAVTVGAVKKTVSRLLILVVSMGFGVVRPTLGGLTSKVLLLGGTYFLAAESLDVVENVNTINDPPGKERLFLVLPVAMLDALFILWTFTSLSRTLEKLQARRRFAKLELYRKFTNSLAMAVVVSVAWIGYELYFKATDPFGERWQSFWVIPAFWYVLAFILLIVICVLWAPSQNSTRYAYSEEVGEDLDEEEVALTASTTATKPSLIVEIEKSGVKPDSKERKSVNTDVFSLDDDLEEDKRD
ncbi:uncharacterized protein C26H5.07c isoform X1 [Physcomitrium patens]|uniref:GOST seven transmembrane domain-containing protein n=3 Tax=Physcomitrium patens TaxID=3218 RepID=A0A7I4D1N5_PHYPA|nr:transmembrane protein 87A-like isoform X1 [Physcomitrium patens]|eukprot:XP_024368153.1 transmembrane protein 87A-like isoform X1 [Physcomitrella patens]